MTDGQGHAKTGYTDAFNHLPTKLSQTQRDQCFQLRIRLPVAHVFAAGGLVLRLFGKRQEVLEVGDPLRR